jgi:hypothetical protein
MFELLLINDLRMDNMLKSALFLATLCLLLFTSNLYSATYYVDNGAGNDGNSGLSTSLAWKTLAKVQSKTFASGDIVSFKCGGRFSGSTITGKSNITFNSYGTGARPVIDGQSVSICFDLQNQTNITFNGLKIVNGTPYDINLWACTYVTVESCNVDSSKGGNHTMASVFSGRGSGLTIRNSTMSFGEQVSNSEGNHGIYIDGTDNCTMEYDTIDGNLTNIRIGFATNTTDTSRHDLNWTDNLIVRYCVVKNAHLATIGDDGSFNAQFYYNVFQSNSTYTTYYHPLIDLFAEVSPWNVYAPRNSKYYNNTFIHYPKESLIWVNNDNSTNPLPYDIVFKNNIFYYVNASDNILRDELGSPSKTWTFTNNLYYSTNGSYIWQFNGTTSSNLSNWQGRGYDANSINANPLFTNFAAGDYSLQSGSPAINSGAFVGLTTDINGTPVPSNYPDMGAFQHISGSGGGGTLPPSTLNLTALIEALYVAGGTAMPISPRVTVELHSSSAPYALVDSNTAALNTAGTGTFTFTKAVSGTGYYIVVKSMNTIETWSAAPQNFTSAALSYNFTTAVTQAFTDGSNPPLALHNGKYCIYSGDLNQDDIINKADYTAVDNDNSTFQYHLANDLNGDGFVSTADEQFIDNNYILSIHRQAPAGAPGFSIRNETKSYTQAQNQ